MAFSFDTLLLSMGFDKFTRRSRLGCLAWPQQPVEQFSGTFLASFR
jgi:hypothetical protein